MTATHVTYSSIRAYDAMRSEGIGRQHAIILSTLQPGERYSRRQIAQLTGLEISAVAGRCNELIKTGELMSPSSIYCPVTGRKVDAIMLAEQQLNIV